MKQIRKVIVYVVLPKGTSDAEASEICFTSDKGDVIAQSPQESVEVKSVPDDIGFDELNELFGE
jgi:hypothetical protein